MWWRWAEERAAKNPQAYNDTLSARLYQETGRLLSQKISEFDPDRKWL